MPETSVTSATLGSGMDVDMHPLVAISSTPPSALLSIPRASVDSTALPPDTLLPNPREVVDGSAAGKAPTQIEIAWIQSPHSTEAMCVDTTPGPSPTIIRVYDAVPPSHSPSTDSRLPPMMGPSLIPLRLPDPPSEPHFASPPSEMMVQLREERLGSTDSTVAGSSASAPPSATSISFPLAAPSNTAATKSSSNVSSEKPTLPDLQASLSSMSDYLATRLAQVVPPHESALVSVTNSMSKPSRQNSSGSR